MFPILFSVSISNCVFFRILGSAGAAVSRERLAKWLGLRSSPHALPSGWPGPLWRVARILLCSIFKLRWGCGVWRECLKSENIFWFHKMTTFSSHWKTTDSVWENKHIRGPTKNWKHFIVFHSTKSTTLSHRKWTCSKDWRAAGCAEGGLVGGVGQRRGTRPALFRRLEAVSVAHLERLEHRWGPCQKTAGGARFRHLSRQQMAEVLVGGVQALQKVAQVHLLII